MMPAQPTPCLVLVKPDLSFSLFEDDLDRPAHATEPYQLRQGDASRRVTQIEFDFRGVPHVPADHQPRDITKVVDCLNKKGGVS